MQSYRPGTNMLSTRVQTMHQRVEYLGYNEVFDTTLQTMGKMKSTLSCELFIVIIFLYQRYENQPDKVITIIG